MEYEHGNWGVNPQLRQFEPWVEDSVCGESRVRARVNNSTVPLVGGVEIKSQPPQNT